MAVRVTQKTLDHLMVNLDKFLPHYIVFDMFKESKYEYHFSLLFNFLQYVVTFDNFREQRPVLDVTDTKIQFGDYFGSKVMKFSSPAIKHWKFECDGQINNFFLGNKPEKMVFNLDNIEFKFLSTFFSTPQGYLQPHVKAIDLRWGNTTITHPDPWAALLLDQAIAYSLVISQNAIYFFGDYIVNALIEAPLTQLLNYYQIPVHIMNPLSIQTGNDYFMFDMRHSPT